MKFFSSLSLVVPLAALVAHASSILPVTSDQQFDAADAVCRATVLGVQCYRDANDGLIYTRTMLRVDEGFKGRFPTLLVVTHRGGEVDGVGFTDDAAPQFKAGEERLLFLSRRANRTLYARNGQVGAMKLNRQFSGFAPDEETLLANLRRKSRSAVNAGADVTDQSTKFEAPSGDASGSSTNGLLTSTNGWPSRFIMPDRGEPIPYLVDATALPTGITLAQALGAVSNAMTLWERASSFRFIFAGTNNFGIKSPAIDNGDGVLRVQLHDLYHHIPPGNILGEGGSWFATPPANLRWGPGGKVSGMEFNRGLNGYVVLAHTNNAMQSLSTFTWVLTHEIGHALGLAHSSDIVTNDPVLLNSVMYWAAPNDGRSPQLNSYDTNVIREVHPLNTPPYCYDRVMDITTTPTPPFGPTNIPGLNPIQLRGYDLQGTNNLSLAITNASSAAGTFALNGNMLSFTPNAFYGTARIDPANSSYYGFIYSRYSDGTNASAYVKSGIVSFNPDTGANDGIPDAWMTSYFGSASGSSATADSDGDKLNNLQEYIAGMNPTNAASAQRATIYSTNVIQWQAKAYELYEIQGAASLTSPNWTRIGNPVIPTNSTGIFTNYLSATNAAKFFRVQKVP